MLPQDVEKLKAEFGDREFTGKDIGIVLGMSDFRGTGTILKSLRKAGIAYQTVDGWRFGAPPESPTVAAPAIAAPVVESAPVVISPSVVRIGEFYLSEHMLLIVHTGNQEGSPALRFYTTIIEVDPATKHPRNKIINFIKARDPREYAQSVAWLDSLAGNPPHADDTALELAAELERKLNAANEEIANLKAKIEAIRGAL